MDALFRDDAHGAYGCELNEILVQCLLVVVEVYEVVDALLWW